MLLLTFKLWINLRIFLSTCDTNQQHLLIIILQVSYCILQCQGFIIPLVTSWEKTRDRLFVCSPDCQFSTNKHRQYNRRAIKNTSIYFCSVGRILMKFLGLPSSSKDGTPYFSSWSSETGVVHFDITSEVIVSTGISNGSILLIRVWNLL